MAETFLVLPRHGEKGEQLHGRAQGQRAFSASVQAPQQFATYVLPSEKKRQKADTGMKHLATSPHPAGEGEDRIC